MENLEILLPNKRYKSADDADLTLKIDLESNETLLRNGERDIVLNLTQLYDNERNESINYKIFGKIKMVFDNMYSGATPYTYLKEKLYLNNDGSTNNFDGFLPYNEFAFLRRDVYRKNYKPQAGDTLGEEYNPTIQTIGDNSHTTITTTSAPFHNWSLYLTYAYSGDTDYQMSYKHDLVNNIDFKSGDGLPFFVTDNDQYYTLYCPVNHGISEGEYIVLSGNTLIGFNNQKENTFYVNSVGNEIYNSQNHFINLLKTQFNDELTINSLIMGKRCLDVNNIESTVSTYYVHKNKTLTQINDYAIDTIGFESNIFKEEKKILIENSSGVNNVIVEKNRMESILFDFKNPFILSGITNNLGITPNEIYLSVIFRNGNGLFNYPPKIGYKFNFHDGHVDDVFDLDKSFENISGTTFIRDGISFISGDTLPLGSIINGSFIEYNKKELKERVISESFHKITNPNTIFDYQQDNGSVYSNASETNPIGLFYQTHYKIKLREISPYIETAKTYDINSLPENAIFDEDEKVWKWRDVYEHGYIDSDNFGTNYPFVNNIHYIKNDINFYLRNERFNINKTNGVKSFDDYNNIC